jgi:hypothetical protein
MRAQCDSYSVNAATIRRGQLYWEFSSAARVNENSIRILPEPAFCATDLLDRFHNGAPIPTGPAQREIITVRPADRLVAKNDDIRQRADHKIPFRRPLVWPSYR